MDIEINMKTKKEKKTFACYEPVFGNAHCYHCGSSYTVVPCTIAMAGVVLKQFGKEHLKCKETTEGKELLAAVTKEVMKYKANNKVKDNLLLQFAPPKNATLGDKVAYQLEMELLTDALARNVIPPELASNERFMKSINALKAANVTMDCKETLTVGKDYE